MMKLMMAGGYQPRPCPAMNERLGKHFPPHVIGDAHEGHNRQHHAERRDVDRDGHDQHRDNHCAGQRFPWVETHRRPGGRWVTGMMNGVNIPATVELARPLKVPVIASGGITNLDDVRALCAVQQEGITGAITGRAIYEGTLNFTEAQKLADELSANLLVKS